eukprot:140007-Rhodomonas_salina.1
MGRAGEHGGHVISGRRRRLGHLRSRPRSLLLSRPLSSMLQSRPRVSAVTSPRVLRERRGAEMRVLG